MIGTDGVRGKERKGNPCCQWDLNNDDDADDDISFPEEAFDFGSFYPQMLIPF